MRKTLSEHERITKGYYPWDVRPEQAKVMGLSAWTQFYHKPYKTDWRQAINKANDRLWDLYGGK